MYKRQQIFCSKDCCYQARQDKTKADREAEKGNHYYRPVSYTHLDVYKRQARESTLNAHYTSPAIIRSIYDTLDRMGFEKGNVLELSLIHISVCYVQPGKSSCMKR